MPKPAGWFITFMAVNIAWVFFRAEDFQTAFAILSAMFGQAETFNIVIFHFKDIALIGLLIIICAIAPGVPKLISGYFKMNRKWLIILIGVFLYTFSQCYQVSEFLYFQF